MGYTVYSVKAHDMLNVYLIVQEMTITKYYNSHEALNIFARVNTLDSSRNT